MDEFKQIFLTECRELISDMEAKLLKLEPGMQELEELNGIFRCAHSIKGGAGALGMDNIMRFTHVMEALLDKMREGKLLPSRESIDALLKSVDVVTQMLNSVEEGSELPENYGAEVSSILQKFASNDAPANNTESKAEEKPKFYQYDITFYPYTNLLVTGNEPLHILQQLNKLGKAEVYIDDSKIPDISELDPTQCYIGWQIRLISSVTQADIDEIFEFVSDVSDIIINCLEYMGPEIPELEQKPANQEQGKASAFSQEAVTNHPASGDASRKPVSANSSIRVDLDKIDKLVNMVGELVITEAMLRDQVKGLISEQFTGLMRGIDELSHHTRELQEAVMSVRMQPVKSIFSRMPRLVRDTSGQLGKDIQLIMSGENTEVDKTVIEQLGDPLTHMIRNSVDHGIEKPETRIAKGKEAQGTIYLSAYHRSGRIIIEIRDNGAGINREKVLAKAKEKGLVTDDAKLTDEQIDHLIFLPGFSTAEQVSSISGRGVGMDVVKRNIESIGGHVRISNTPGEGSTFAISLPLTLAILDGMIVRVGNENYIVPITSIIETLSPKSETIKKVQGRSDVINVRGDFVSLVYLSKVFNIHGAENDAANALVVLVESGRQKFGLVVDELIGQQQVVIKSLEANTNSVKGISGATILGDGKVSLILEINELVQQIGQNNVVQLNVNKNREANI